MTKLISLRLSDGDKMLTEKFLSRLEVSSKTKNDYKRALKQFFLYAYDHNIRDPQRKDIVKYKNYLKEKQLSSCTISTYLSVIRNFFSFLQDKKFYPNICESVKLKITNINRKEILTIDQVKTLLNHINTFTTLEDLRNKSLIMLLITTGLRIVEIERSNVGDVIQSKNQNILIIQGKGKKTKDDFIVINDDTLNVLNDYLTMRRPISNEEPLFISLSDRNYGGRLTTRSLSRIVKEIFKQIGIDSEKITAHSLRHTALTFSLMIGSSIEEVKEMARHKNISHSIKYRCLNNVMHRIDNAPEKKLLNVLNNNNRD